MVVVLCVAAVAVARWWRISAPYDAARLISALPTDRATVVYLDTEQLRRSGMLALLAGSKAAEEPDYLKFVNDTGFDYRTDLDAVAAAFEENRFYATLRGRFRWKQLTAYAESQGGECHYSVCTMLGSTPDHNISFYPLKPDVLALAVSTDPRAVNKVLVRWATRQMDPCHAVALPVLDFSCRPRGLQSARRLPRTARAPFSAL